jgi:hypothetical protein
MSTTTCPFCNAVVPLDEAAHGRVTCPRCGEAVPVPALNGDYVAPAATATVSAPSSVSRRQHNRLLGLGVVVGMLILAAVVALLLINTRGKRRLSTLAESEAVGYLPDDTNVIFALNPAEADRTTEGKETLAKLSPDLERLVGLKAEQVEAVVIGLRVDTNVFPRTRIVVRTKSEIDFDAVRAKLQAGSAKKDKDREYYPFTIRGLPLPLEFALWSPAPHTLVAVYPPTEVGLVPAQPSDNADRFAAPLAELLKARPERDSFIWLAAHNDNWNNTSLHTTLPLLGLSREFVKKAGEVRTIGLAMRKETGATTTRARPARVSEGTPPDPRAVALDLVLIGRPDADMPDLIDGLTSWADAQHLATNNANSSDVRYSVTLVGAPEDWSRAFGGLMKKPK